MNTEKILQVYIEIETQTFREEKKRRLEDFIKVLQLRLPKLTLDEVISTTTDLLKRGITVRYPFYIAVIYPTLFEGVEKNNLAAIKLLITLHDLFGSYQNRVGGGKYNSSTLIQQGLNIASDDRELLIELENRTRSYLEYTIHELPTGILYGSNGATIEECEELISELNTYQSVCKKLQRDKSDLIEKCNYYYPAYKTYLSVYKKYNGFADFLSKEWKPSK